MHGIHDAGELREQAIPGRVHHPAVELPDKLGHGLNVGFDEPDRSRLVLPPRDRFTLLFKETFSGFGTVESVGIFIHQETGGPIIGGGSQLEVRHIGGVSCRLLLSFAPTAAKKSNSARR
jgi:hypothetical protein